MLTPIEIHNTQHKQGRGYSKKEMDAFLEQIASDYEELYKENIELKEKIEKLSDGIQYYKSMEGTLQKALVLAEKTSKDTIDSANKQAEIIEKEARFRAEQAISYGKNNYEAIRQQCLALIQQYNQFKLQFKQIAIKQIELFDSDFYEIYTNDIMSKLNESIDSFVMPNDSVPNDINQDDINQDDIIQAESNLDDASDIDTVQEESGQEDVEEVSCSSETIHDDNAKNDDAKNDDAKNEVNCDETVKDDNNQEEPVEEQSDDIYGVTKEIPVIKNKSEDESSSVDLSDIIPSDENIKKANYHNNSDSDEDNDKENEDENEDEVDSLIRDLRNELSANIANVTDSGSSLEFLESDNL